MKKCTGMKNHTVTKNYTDINAKTIDLWVEKGWEWGIPIIGRANWRPVKNGFYTARSL
jgi:hypothetical protein